MKSAVVTGGTGFIGSVLVKRLVDAGVYVVLLTRNKRNVICHGDLVEVIEYNPTQAFQTKITGVFDCFYNLGWGGVSTNSKDNFDLQLENIKTSVETIRLASKLSCKKFIAAGTVAEYVFCESVMDIEAKQSPNDYYGAAKTATHYFLDVEARRLGMAMNWVVIPSTYGKNRKGENIITYTIDSLLKHKKTQYGNLQQLWDFLYVDDVADALFLIGEKGIRGKPYGIGSGIYKPLKWYIEYIRDYINPEADLGIGLLPDMSNRTYSSCVNIDALQNDTGFVPKYSFEKGIANTIDWHIERLAKKDELYKNRLQKRGGTQIFSHKS